jgi:hypothetical protein
LQPCAVGGGKSRLIGIDLHRYGNAGQDARVLAPGHHLIDPVSLLQYEIRAMGDDRIDLRIDGIEPLKRSLGSLTGGDLARAHELGQFGRGKTPEFGHDLSHPCEIAAASARSLP